MTEKRDLRKELEFCDFHIENYKLRHISLTGFLERAIIGWPKAINRAIEAESKNTESYDFLYSAFDKVKEEAEQLKQDNIALAEENDIQRQSIQNLSAQVVAYREIAHKILQCEPILRWGYNGPEVEGRCVPKEITDKIRELLRSPDPGEKIRAVVEAARKLLKECDEYGISWQLLMDLKHRLADLEGGATNA